MNNFAFVWFAGLICGLVVGYWMALEIHCSPETDPEKPDNGLPDETEDDDE